MTLHTSAGCSVSTSSLSLLQSVSQDCDAADNGNEGCSFHETNSNSFGTQFNAQGGGTYATEWTSAGISIWFWPAGGAPSDVLGDSPDPTGWGTPVSTWGGSDCTWDNHFMDHNLVFDTTFCGSWASNDFQSCSAANNGQTCEAFVQNNPSAFTEAYWQVNALRVYEDNGQAAPSSALEAAVTASSTSSSAAAATTVQPTTFATSPSSAVATAPLAEGSTGGIFLPDPTPVSSSSSAAAVSSSSAAATTHVAEASTGGIFLPFPTPSNSSSSANATSSALSFASTSAIVSNTSSSAVVSTASGPAVVFTTASPTAVSITSSSSTSPAATITASTSATPEAPAAAVSTLSELCDENSTGGVYVPVPTNQPSFEKKGHGGTVHKTGRLDRQRLAHLPRHGGMGLVA